MTIIKKRINFLLGNYVLLENDITKSLVRINFEYVSNGFYELDIFIATKPNNKLFKGWQRIGYTLEFDEHYKNLDIMFKVNGSAYLKRYLEQKTVSDESLKKWQEFIKNT